MSDKQEYESPDVSQSAHSDETTPPAKPSLAGRISKIVWDRDDKSEEERKFVQRLDLGLLTAICVGYWIKYLDQANVSNAYVSGMSADLKFTGDQYNTLLTCFTVGYTIGQFFSTLVMVKVGAHIWLPLMEVIWTILVMVCSVAQNPQTLMALRFFIGLCESAAYPGGLWLLGSWYNKSELGKRAVLFICASSIGTMFSGYLQTAVLNLHSVGGKTGWQWLFIMDGVIGLPIAFAGFFILPGTPDRPNPLAKWWLRQKDIDMGLARMQRVGRAPTTGFSFAKFKSAFSNIYLYMFFVPYTCFVLGLSSYAYMNLWLKATKLYSTALINVIPTGGYALQVVCALIYSWTSDAIGSRWQVVMVAGFIAFIGNLILAIWPASQSAIFAGFFLSFTVVGAGALTLAWANELVAEASGEHRAIILGFLNTAAYVFNSWVPNLVFPASQAPTYPGKGYKVTVAFWAVYVICIGGIAFYVRTRGTQIKPKDEEVIEEDVVPYKATE